MAGLCSKSPLAGMLTARSRQAALRFAPWACYYLIFSSTVCCRHDETCSSSKSQTGIAGGDLLSPASPPAGACRGVVYVVGLYKLRRTLSGLQHYHTSEMLNLP